MSKIIDRAGKGAAISAAENDANLDSLHGINAAVAGTAYTVTVADQGNTLEFTSASAVAVTLTSIATIIGNADTSDFKVTLIATGAGTVTVTPDGLNTINNGASTIVLTTDEYTTIQTDSTALIWNIINGLGDATTLDGLDSAAFAQLAVANTFIQDQTIVKNAPFLTLDSTSTGDAVLRLRKGGASTALVFWERASDALVFRKLDATGSVTTARINMTAAGKVNVATGTFQLAGVDVTSTAAELNILDGVTSTTAELNILDGVTSTAAELNILDGVTSTAAELNILDGVTSTAAELNIMDGSATVQATVTLVGTDGVVISDADVMKQALVSDFATFVSANLTNPVFTGTLTVGLAQLSEAELEILDGATVTTAELNILDGVTSTAAELNILDGVTSTAAELNILDGITSTTAELNILDGVTSTAAELNILDGVTSTTAELNILDGVTSTAAELNLVDGSVAGTAVASKALVLGALKNIDTIDVTKDGFKIGTAAMTCTAAELNTLDGITSTTAELNILDGVTSTAAELSITDGDSADSSVVIADADQFIINNGGVMEQTAATDVALYTKNENNAGLNTEIIDIGDWNMDLTQTVAVSHSIADHTKVRSLTAIIRDDSDISYVDFVSVTDSAGTSDKVMYIDGTFIRLTRQDGGLFDSANYDSTTYNRGWITVQYID